MPPSHEAPDVTGFPKGVKRFLALAEMSAMRFETTRYSTWILDCDGVLLDSNRAKAQAFYTAALPYGVEVAERIRAYHQANGGISRFRKFRYVFEELLGRQDYEADYLRMVEDFSVASRAELERCQPLPGVREFLAGAPAGIRRFVVSGAEEEELRWCVAFHGLDRFFDGVFGSPRSKVEIMSDLIAKGGIVQPALYFGDSRYDSESAAATGCDFVFVSGATDFRGWEDLVRERGLASIVDFRELVDAGRPVL
jgi:phosphoglycolate phosphatase-like HAD superfamily hydrolase